MERAARKVCGARAGEVRKRGRKKGRIREDSHTGTGEKRREGLQGEPLKNTVTAGLICPT